MADLKVAECSFKKAIEIYLCSPSPQNMHRLQQSGGWYADEWITTFTLPGDKENRDKELKKLDGIDDETVGPKE